MTARVFPARLTTEQLTDPKHARALYARVRRIRIASGEYVRGERLTRDDALRIAYEAEIARLAKPAPDPVAPPADPDAAELRAARRSARSAERSAAWRARNPDYMRAYRLKQRPPEGVTAETWAAIVDHFKARCPWCQSPATRTTRLPDGTPVPACAAHVVQGSGA